jgi:hypothetical protein
MKLYQGRAINHFVRDPRQPGLVNKRGPENHPGDRPKRQPLTGLPHKDRHHGQRHKRPPDPAQRGHPPTLRVRRHKKPLPTRHQRQHPGRQEPRIVKTLLLELTRILDTATWLHRHTGPHRQNHEDPLQSD